MEKSNDREQEKTVQEGLQIQDFQNQRMNPEGSQSNRQSQKSEEQRTIETSHLEATYRANKQFEQEKAVLARDSQQNSKVNELPEDTVKSTEQEPLKHKESEVSEEVAKPLAEAREPAEKLLQREQMMRAILTYFFYQQNQAILQHTKTQQENIHSFDKSLPIERQQTDETVTPGKSEDNVGAAECGSESGYNVLTSSEGSKDDTSVGYQKTKEEVELEYAGTILVRVHGDEPQRPQPSKGYVTLRRPKLNNDAPGFQKSKEYISVPPRTSDDVTVYSKKTKDYVAVIPRKLDADAPPPKTKGYLARLPNELVDATMSPQTAKDYVAVLPSKTDVVVQPPKTKDYVTAQRPGSGVVTVLKEISKEYVNTFPFCQSFGETSCPPRVKDYVTARPKEFDEATPLPQKSKDDEVFIPQSEDDYIFVPSQSKGYVAMIPVENKASLVPEPPTHIFWPVRRFQDNESGPKTPTQVTVPPRFSEKSRPVSELEAPHNVRMLTKQLEDNMEMSLPFPGMCNLLQEPVPQEFTPTSENDDLPILQFDEFSEVQRNSYLDSLITLLPTGIRDLMQRTHGHTITSERLPVRGYLTFFYGILIGSVITAAVLYYLMHNSSIKFNNPGFGNVHETQSQPLNVKEDIPITQVGISTIDFSAGITTPVVDLDVNDITLEKDLNFANNPRAYLGFDTTALDDNLNLANDLRADLDIDTTLAMNDFNIDENAKETYLGISEET